MRSLAIAGLALNMGVLAAAGDVGLLVVPFDGPGNLGARAATVLNLQVWQTLRAAPTPNPRRLHFGSGTVYYWTEGSQPVRSHAEAEKAADDQVHAVLWGRAQQYGKGVVVQAYLSAPRAQTPNHPGIGIWKIDLPNGQTISVDIPAWLYEFAPIVLKPEVVLELNTPQGLKIYRSPRSSEVVGTIRDNFRALEQGPDFTKVEANGVFGWVRLPALSRNRSEVVDFTGALVRIFRKDWGGAIDLFERVLRTSSAPVTIRAYSLLLMSVASEQLSRQIGTPSRAVEYVEQAYRLNPYLQATIRYKCMTYLAAMARDPSARQRLADTVARNDYLFAKSDPWIGKVKTLLARPR